MGITKEIQMEEARWSDIDAASLLCFADIDKVGKTLRSVASKIANGLCGCQPISEVKDDDSLVVKTNNLRHRSAKVIGTVLYVDDESDNLELFKAAFDEVFEIVTARNGFEALQVMRDRSIDILVTDQRMPAMTGTELCKIVRKQYPETVRVIISAYNPASYEEACKEAQIRCFIQKPWNSDNVIQLLREAIESGTGEHANEHATIIG